MPRSPPSRRPPLASKTAPPASPTHADMIYTLEQEVEFERQACHEEVFTTEALERGFNAAQEIWYHQRALLVERVEGLEMAEARSNSSVLRMKEEVCSLKIALKAAQRQIQTLTRRHASSEFELASTNEGRAALERKHLKTTEAFAAREARLKAETIERGNIQQEIASAQAKEIVHLKSRLRQLISEQHMILGEADEQVRRERAEADEQIKALRLEYMAECSKRRDAMASRQLQVADERVQALHEAAGLAKRATEDELVMDNVTQQPVDELDEQAHTSVTRLPSTRCIGSTHQGQHPLQKSSHASTGKDHEHKSSIASSGIDQDQLHEQQRKLGQMHWQKELLQQVRKKQIRSPYLEHAHKMEPSDQVVEQQFAAAIADHIENPATLQECLAAYLEWRRRKDQHLEHERVALSPRERFPSPHPRNINVEHTSSTSEAGDVHMTSEGNSLDLEEWKAQAVSTRSLPDFVNQSLTELIELSEPSTDSPWPSLRTDSAWPSLRAASDDQGEDFLEGETYVSL